MESALDVVCEVLKYNDDQNNQVIDSENIKKISFNQILI